MAMPTQLFPYQRSNCDKYLIVAVGSERCGAVLQALKSPESIGKDSRFA